MARFRRRRCRHGEGAAGGPLKLMAFVSWGKRGRELLSGVLVQGKGDMVAAKASSAVRVGNCKAGLGRDGRLDQSGSSEASQRLPGILRSWEGGQSIGNGNCGCVGMT